MSRERKAKVAKINAAKQERKITPDKPATFSVDSSAIAKSQFGGSDPSAVFSAKRNEPQTAPQVSVPKVTPVTAKAEVSNPAGISAPVAKPQTLSDMLAEQRKAVVKEKTDAAKMQKYYALTDAFNALGRMGGAAIGGAIGGNVLDSAPAVPEYQPSRGYMIAFEEAKRANDRLRSLDDKTFTLAISKQQRDEDRAYSEKVKAEDRKYQAEQNRINREYQAEQNRLTREWNKAVAENNLKEQERIENAQIQLRHKNDMELQRLKNQYRAAEQAGSRANMQYQYDLYNKPVQVAFDDGTALELAENQYEGLFNFLNGKTIGGKMVNKDNFTTVLRENPRIVNDYLNLFGGGASKAASESQQATGGNADNASEGERQRYYYYNTVADKSMQTSIPTFDGTYSVEKDMWGGYLE